MAVNQAKAMPTKHDAISLNDEVSDQDLIDSLRESYQIGFNNIKETFLAKPNTQLVFKQHTKLVDGILKQLWAFCKISKDCSLIAVGGYGRGELFPYSDLDLLILTPEGFDKVEANQQSLEKLVGLFWDIGLNVGHSVRTLKECVAESENDVTIQTNLLECRLLIGKSPSFEAYLSAVAASIDVPTFFKAKIQEQQNRYAKFNDTAYNLEPNIKESPGGLRDLHAVIWLTRSLVMSKQSQRTQVAPLSTIFKNGDKHLWAWLVEKGIISSLELRQIKAEQKNLFLLRTHLHYVSNRREDRLLFDFQNDIAAILGFTTQNGNRASEQLMKSYYRSVKFIQVMNEILIKTSSEFASKVPPVIQSIDDFFETKNQLLEVKSDDLLAQQPTKILDAFLLMQQHPEIKGIGAKLLRNMQRVKKHVNKAFRQDPVNKARFIEILSQPEGVHKALRAMNRYGILGRYIPAFGKITGQMQHDLFHIYTVDEHILNVLGNLRRFAKPELAHEFPLCTELFEASEKPHLLYLGALFHDIAKGRNGDHSSLGKVDAERFCRAHKLPKEDGDLVAWLVDAHLNMSSTAQKSDLSDPSVIESFAKFVKTERRLVALYLLTVADIRGTSLKVWNAWKARLLENLFMLAKDALATNEEYQKQAIAQRKNEASEKLAVYGLKPSSYQRLWEKFGPNYIVRHESDEIVWHSRLLTAHLHAKEPIVRAHLSPNGDGIQVMIYQKVHKDLFSKICNFFDRMSYTIVEAKIFTTDHGYALDTFIVLDDSGTAVSYTGLLQFIEDELTSKLVLNEVLENPIKGRISRRIQHMPYKTQVNVSEVADDHHKIEINTSDVPGLLAKITQLFIDHEISVYNAKIFTMGDRAEDTFLISGHKQQKLTGHKIKALKEAIIAEI